MISFLAGKVIQKKESYIVLDNQGIGFKVFLSERDLGKIKENEEIKIYSHLCFRNDKPEIYGLLSLEQLEVFELLEKISGIGPKASLIIASLGSFEDLKKAVENHDFKYFQDIKGVGKKKIQKIILEMSGEIRKMTKPDKLNEEVRALTSLGFSSQDAKKALNNISLDLSTEERVKKALQLLGKA